MSGFMFAPGLPLSGGTLTGPLILPANGLTVGTQLTTTSGSVTATGLTLGNGNPVANLSVALITDITKSVTIVVNGTSYKLLAIPS